MSTVETDPDVDEDDTFDADQAALLGFTQPKKQCSKAETMSKVTVTESISSPLSSEH